MFGFELLELGAVYGFGFEDFDLLFGFLELDVALGEELGALLVVRDERLEREFAILHLSDDLFQFLETLFEGRDHVLFLDAHEMGLCEEAFAVQGNENSKST